MLELLLADDRTTCARPFFSPSNQAYDVALRNVKRRRNARFRGLVRFVLLLEPMRLQAATKVYAPGGAGFAAAAASFRAAAVHSKGPVSRPACASSTATPATPAMPGRRRQGRRLQGRRRQGKRRQRRQRSQGRRRQRRRLQSAKGAGGAEPFLRPAAAANADMSVGVKKNGGESTAPMDAGTAAAGSESTTNTTSSTVLLFSPGRRTSRP